MRDNNITKLFMVGWSWLAAAIARRWYGLLGQQTRLSILNTNLRCFKWNFEISNEKVLEFNVWCCCQIERRRRRWTWSPSSTIEATISSHRGVSVHWWYAFDVSVTTTTVAIWGSCKLKVLSCARFAKKCFVEWQKY